MTVRFLKGFRVRDDDISLAHAKFEVLVDNSCGFIL